MRCAEVAHGEDWRHPWQCRAWRDEERSQRKPGKPPPSHNSGLDEHKHLETADAATRRVLGVKMQAMGEGGLPLKRGAEVMEGPINPSPDQQVIVEVDCDTEVKGRVAGPRAENSTYGEAGINVHSGG